MRDWWCCTMLFGLWALLSLGTATAQNSLPGRVVAVADGDTLTLRFIEHPAPRLPRSDRRPRVGPAVCQPIRPATQGVVPTEDRDRPL